MGRVKEEKYTGTHVNCQLYKMCISQKNMRERKMPKMQLEILYSLTELTEYCINCITELKILKKYHSLTDNFITRDAHLKTDDMLPKCTHKYISFLLFPDTFQYGSKCQFCMANVKKM